MTIIMAVMILSVPPFCQLYIPIGEFSKAMIRDALLMIVLQFPVALHFPRGASVECH